MATKHTLLLPFLFLIFITLTIITTTTILSPTYTSIPYSLHNQLSNLQAEVGSLLEDFHNNNDKTMSVHTDMVVKIAASLDKFASRFSSKSPVGCDDAFLETGGDDNDEDDGTDTFLSKEARAYGSPKMNRNGGRNFMGTEEVRASVGLACAAVKTSYDRYMSYKVYHDCPDDWFTAQALMIAGCDPLPRRRCFAKSPSRYTKPLPSKSSLWSFPNPKNILWTHYRCKDFNCLTSTTLYKGFNKCTSCFNISSAGAATWQSPTSTNSSARFPIDQVLALKPDEIRIGVDFSMTTGDFAAAMRAKNVTIASATLNLGAPFNEVIALRGLIPLYIGVGTRLPFFDNTMDLVHTYMFLDGWIGVELLQFVLFDWDRVLRPGGLMWIDRFFCNGEDMEVYLEEFRRLGYKKLLWRIVPKTDREADELFFSAVLEKPIRR